MPEPRRRSIALCVVTLVTLGACGGDAPLTALESITTSSASCYGTATQPVADDASVVSLDGAQRFQVMQGFGTTSRLFDDPHMTQTFDPATKRASATPSPSDQAKILDALYIDLGLTRVRFHQSDDGGLEPVNDNGDPMVADLSKFDFSFKQGDGHIAAIRNMLSRGVTTYYASPITLEKWMNESNPEEYAEWAIVQLRYWRDRGLEMPYYSIKNEPGYSPGDRTWSAEWMRSVVKILGARIKAEGLKTKLVVPDDVSPAEAYARLQVILADPVARQYVGAIGYHIYQRGGEDKIKQLGAQYNLPIWMTEFSTPDSWFEWAIDMHQLIADYGVSAVDYMWGYFGDWDRSQLIRIRVNDGAYAGYEFNRQYYVMGQYSRYVRPGAVRIAAASADPEVKATAYVDGAKLIVVAINVDSREHTVRVELGGASPCVRKADAVRTSETENWVAAPTLTVDAPRFSATLPARSITTFVGRE